MQAEDDAPQPRRRRRPRSVLDSVCDRLDESGVCDSFVDEHCSVFADFVPGCEARHEWYSIYEAYMVEVEAFLDAVLEELGTTAEEVFEAAQRRRGRNERVQHMLDRLQTAADFEGFCSIMRERHEILMMLYGDGSAPRPETASPDAVETGSPNGSPYGSPYHD